jgi:hypothetical protein
VTHPEFARHWARELGASEASLVQLQGGINNRVYVCGKGVERHVIKGYSEAILGQRDRMRAEVEFLCYSARVAPHYVPRLMQVDPERRCVVLEHLDGRTYPGDSTPAPSDIDAAVAFFRALNADPAAARQWVHLGAAEGFLRLTDHVANVQNRIATMGTDHVPLVAQTHAKELLSQVRAACTLVAENVERAIRSGCVTDAIEASQRCVSASDFGFHNAIRTAAGVKFIDFEFAGWDDPAKAAVDFVLQPRVPTGSDVRGLLAALAYHDASEVVGRCGVLGPLLRLKWVCIMLRVLQPDRLAQLTVIHPQTDPADLTQDRLEQARHYLLQETPFGIY